MKRSNQKHEYKRINQKLFYMYIVTLIFIQALGLFFLFHNLNFNLAIIAAVALGFLAPILLGLVFIMLAKKLQEETITG